MIIRIFKYGAKQINKIVNTCTLKLANVKYVNMPIITGRLLVRNNGLISIGKGVKFNSSITSNYVGINKACTISVAKKARLSIGNYSGFSGVSIFCANEIYIGDYVNMGGNVCVWDTDFHPLDYKLRRNGSEGTKTGPITIENDVFIGANSIILKGVTISKKSIIGAGSVVTKNIPANEVWAGNPARFIKKL